MRPKIPDGLAERIQQAYEPAGYATESEFIRDAIRRRLEEVQSSQNTMSSSEERVHDFEFTSLKSTSQQQRNGEYPPIHVRPEGTRISDRANDGKRLVLSTDEKDIEPEEIKTPLRDLDFVSGCALTRNDPWDRNTENDGWIRISLDADHVTNTDLDLVVDTILNTIDKAIVNAESLENPKKELEDALRRQVDS